MRAKGHTDRVIYVTWVLWLIGMSESSIAAVLLKRRKQISGIVGKSPYSNRSGMTDKQRQKELDDLLLVRRGDDGKTVDEGLLDPVVMKIIPLRGRQRKTRGG